MGGVHGDGRKPAEEGEGGRAKTAVGLGCEGRECVGVDVRCCLVTLSLEAVACIGRGAILSSCSGDVRVRSGVGHGHVRHHERVGEHSEEVTTFKGAARLGSITAEGCKSRFSGRSNTSTTADTAPGSKEQVVAHRAASVDGGASHRVIRERLRDVTMASNSRRSRGRLRESKAVAEGQQEVGVRDGEGRSSGQRVEPDGGSPARATADTGQVATSGRAGVVKAGEESRVGSVGGGAGEVALSGGQRVPNYCISEVPELRGPWSTCSIMDVLPVQSGVRAEGTVKGAEGGRSSMHGELSEGGRREVSCAGFVGGESAKTKAAVAHWESDLVRGWSRRTRPLHECKNCIRELVLHALHGVLELGPGHCAGKVGEVGLHGGTQQHKPVLERELEGCKVVDEGTNAIRLGHGVLGDEGGMTKRGACNHEARGQVGNVESGGGVGSEVRLEAEGAAFVQAR